VDLHGLSDRLERSTQIRNRLKPQDQRLARWLEGGKQRQVSLPSVGCNTAPQRKRFAKELSEELIADKRNALLGLAATPTLTQPEPPTYPEFALCDAVNAFLKTKIEPSKRPS
jgi:hypothetical protein